jgi:hypothetical protein
MTERRDVRKSFIATKKRAREYSGPLVNERFVIRVVIFQE